MAIAITVMVGVMTAGAIARAIGKIRNTAALRDGVLLAAWFSVLQ